MSGGSTKQEQSNKIDPALMALYNKNYQQAQDIASTPFQAYGSERVAGFTPTQLEAQGYLTDIARNRTGADTLAQAKGGIGGLSGYTPGQITAPGSVSAGSVNAVPVNAGMLRDTDLTQSDAAIRYFAQEIDATAPSDPLSRLHALMDGLHDEIELGWGHPRIVSPLLRDCFLNLLDLIRQSFPPNRFLKMN